MEQTNAVQKRDKTEMEFVPFGQDKALKLSIGIVQNYCCVPTRSGKLPSMRDCMVFMMKCRNGRLDPFSGDAILQGYDSKEGPKFSMIVQHQTYLKRAQSDQNFDGLQSGVIVKDSSDRIIERIGDFMLDGDELLGGWATCHMKNREYPFQDKINLKTFNKGFGRWQDDPAGMIVKCAEASVFRKAFPNSCGSLYVQEEMGSAVDVPSHVYEEQRPEVPQVIVEASRRTAETVSDAQVHDAPILNQKSRSNATKEDSLTVQLSYMLEGVSYDEFSEFVIRMGYWGEAGSFASYDQIPAATAKRLLRIKGLKESIIEARNPGDTIEPEVVK